MRFFAASSLRSELRLRMTAKVAGNDDKPCVELYLQRFYFKALADNISLEAQMVIAVIGDSSCSAEEAKLAEAVGEGLAQQGATIVCGGLGGVMEAVCRGAREKGGMTIGVLPGEDISMANQWVDIPIATGVGYARNMAVVKSAQAVIAIGGNYGTLSEIAYALKSGIPVIGLNTWSLSRNGKEVDAIIRVGNAGEAVDKAISLARKREN